MVKPAIESADKRYGYSGKKIGNAHLKWALSQAALLFLRESDQAKRYVNRLEKKHNKGKALSILTKRLGRSVFFILKRKEAFNLALFFQQ